LYAELARLTASPVVELNRAIAETEGPEEGRRIVDRLGLDDFRYLHSTRGASSTPRGGSTRRATPTDVRGNSPTTAQNGASSNDG
jgi:predicted RNA polymerase sigma factor